MYSVVYVYKATVDLKKLSREWGHIYKGLRFPCELWKKPWLGLMQEVDFQKLVSSDKSTDYGAFNSLKKHIEKKCIFMGADLDLLML